MAGGFFAPVKVHLEEDRSPVRRLARPPAVVRERPGRKATASDTLMFLALWLLVEHERKAAATALTELRNLSSPSLGVLAAFHNATFRAVT